MASAKVLLSSQTRAARAPAVGSPARRLAMESTDSSAFKSSKKFDFFCRLQGQKFEATHFLLDLRDLAAGKARRIGNPFFWRFHKAR